MATSAVTTQNHQDKQGGPFAQLAEAVCLNFEATRRAWGPHLFHVDVQLCRVRPGWFWRGQAKAAG